MSEAPNDSPKIYLLPNLMTAGNLFCGFAASLLIVKGTLALEKGEPSISFFNQTYFHLAIWLILAACIFDLLDGRLARLGGHESEFGREFDSLADVISFGVAPALLLYKIVLQDFAPYGWIVAFLYLLCGALRLARFNCIAAKGGSADKDFRGFPIPAAAGVISSVTLFILWWEDKDRDLGNWKYLLLALMIFLSFMMFSKFKYPSFKALNWRTKGSIPRFIVIFLLLIFTVLNYAWMPAVIFISYLLYGFLRPFLSHKMRHEIEDPEEDEDLPDSQPPLQ
jgi:CDP-diacylglycerol---serine O-phosphatidyltransferase